MKKSNMVYISLIIATALILSALYFKDLNNTQDHMQTKEEVSVPPTVHRLRTACDPNPGETIEELQNVYINSTTTVDGYKELLDCSYAENSYRPQETNEYFAVRDTVRNINYYIIDGYEDILGNLNIVGVKDNLLFYNHCWEGCSTPEYFELSLSEKDKTINVYPQRIDVLYRQGLPPGSQMVIHKNRVFFIGEHDIFELNTKNFSLTKIKTIEKDKFFASYGDDHYSNSYPIFEKKDDGILFKIYNDVSSMSVDETKLGTYFLKI